MGALLITLSASSQTQVGYVRTLERPRQASVGIEGVTVNILEYPNAIVTKKKGKFSFAIPGKKQGGSFTVARIEKKGYTLVDKQLRGRRYAYSADVPLEIVMVSNQQLEKDKLQIEKKAIEKARNNYERKIASLEKLLQEKAISEQEHGEQLEQLAKDYENYISLIDKMAERYALTDYRGLSDINRQINECIENAELERADSLINSKGSFDQREQEIRSQLELNRKAAEVLAQSQKDAEFKLNDLAQDYYNKYTIFAANYQNDSAAYYLERRANLDDTTNVEWLYDAACYLKDIGNIDKALSLFLKAHSQYVATGTNNLRHALILETIADTYYDKSDDINAKPFYDLAIDAFEAINTLHPHLVHCYNRLLFSITSTMKNGQKIWDAFEGTKLKVSDGEDYYKDKVILNKIYDNPVIDLDNIFFEDGSWSSDIDYNKAVLYHERVLSKVDSIYGPNCVLAAIVHMSLGKAYRYSRNLDKSLENYVLASQIINSIDSLNPELSDLYEKMADFFRYAKKDTAAAINCYQKAIHILKKVYGINQKMGVYYRSLGDLYDKLHEYQSALESYFEALDNDKRIYGEKSNWIIQTNSTISLTYRNLGDFDKAIEYLQMNKSIIDQRLEWNSSRDKTAQYDAYYRELGDIYFLKKDYSSALDAYYNKINVDTIEYGEKGIIIWEDYGKIGSVYLCQGDTVKAVENFVKSLEMLKADKREKLKGLDEFDANFMLYYTRCDYYQAVRCFIDALEFMQRSRSPFISFSAERILRMIKQSEQSNE